MAWTKPTPSLKLPLAVSPLSPSSRVKTASTLAPSTRPPAFGKDSTVRK